MKQEKKPVIVVEGKTDIDKVGKLVDAILVSTNGSEVSRETINYIKTLSLTRKIIVLTDPDYPGLRIREIISQALPECSHAFVNRKKASNGKKLGVAESPDEEIIKALNNVISGEYKESNYCFTACDLYELGLLGKNNSSFLREKVFEHYNLGYGSAKTLQKRLSQVGITKEELKKFLKEEENEGCK